MSADPRFTHHCDAEDEARVAVLVMALRPFLPSSPLPSRHPAARIPRQRRPVDHVAEFRIRAWRAATPPIGTRLGGHL